MKVLFIILAFLIYHGVNILIAYINERIVVSRIKSGNPKQINHPLWTAIYIALILPVYLLFHSFWLIGAIVLLHLSVFPVAYNLYRGLAPFNLSKTSAALTDKFMVSIGLKDTEIVNLSAELGAIVLMVTSIYG